MKSEPIDTMRIKRALTHAVSVYDRKQSGKKGYNAYALPQYFERVDNICADIARGANVRAAIVAGFTGRLADVCLRAVSQSITTNDEARGGMFYEPVTDKAGNTKTVELGHFINHGELGATRSIWRGTGEPIVAVGSWLNRLLIAQ